MPLEIVDVHVDWAGSRNLGGWSVRLSRLRSRCGGALFRTWSHGGHFSWQVQEKPRVLVVQSRLSVIGARDRSGCTSKCDRRGALIS